jgi:hypothetical protein
MLLDSGVREHALDEPGSKASDRLTFDGKPVTAQAGVAEIFWNFMLRLFGKICGSGYSNQPAERI